MESTTFWTRTTIHSQSTATLVPSQVSPGLWSSPTRCKTITHLRPKLSTYTTCQSTKMRLNGTAIVCQCPVSSPFGMSPPTGEGLVIFLPMAWITEITCASHCRVMISWWSLLQSHFVSCPSFWIFAETSVRTAPFSLLTVRHFLFMSTVISARVYWAAILVEEYITKITLVNMAPPTPLSGALPRWVPHLNSGSDALNEDFVVRKTYSVLISYSIDYF